jgi:hypothetical protein
MFHWFSDPQQLLRLSNRVLVSGLAMLLAGVYGAYLYEGPLSIQALVSLHTMTIVGPTLLKIGYVMRLLSQHRLNRPFAKAMV